MGVGISASFAFDPRRYKWLVWIPVGHLFGTHITYAGIKSGVFLRDYVFVLLEMLAADLTRDVVTQAMETKPRAALSRSIDGSPSAATTHSKPSARTDR